MAGIIERIFPLGSNLANLEKYSGGKFSPVPSTLIIGSPHSMKTAILMQAAVSEGNVGGQVLFIAPSKLGQLPPSVHGMARPTSSAMNNIQFLYATHTAELQGYLASIHLTPAKDLPTLIIIDDLNMYVATNDPGDVTQMMVNIARIMSLAQETAQYCCTNFENGSQNTDIDKKSHMCSLLMAWTKCSSDLFKLSELELFAKDFCHHVWTINQLSNKGISHYSSREYHMVQSLCGALCTISFSGRRISSPTQDIILQEAVLEYKVDSEGGSQNADQVPCDTNRC